jgi:GTPase SAR1 family protein
MYDCSNLSSFENIKEWLHVVEECNDKQIPIVIIGNKIDIREINRLNKRVIEYEDGLKIAQVNIVSRFF